jgi:hypothetical protein
MGSQNPGRYPVYRERRAVPMLDRVSIPNLRRRQLRLSVMRVLARRGVWEALSI